MIARGDLVSKWVPKRSAATRNASSQRQSPPPAGHHGHPNVGVHDAAFASDASGSSDVANAVFRRHRRRHVCRLKTAIGAHPMKRSKAWIASFERPRRVRAGRRAKNVRAIRRYDPSGSDLHRRSRPPPRRRQPLAMVAFSELDRNTAPH
jgi:hypothetical protein